MRFILRSFDELSTRELHDLLRLRVDVFVVEQRCAYPELDGNDPGALHLLGFEQGELAAYGRWYRRGETTVLGRLLVRRELRGRGFGRRLTAEALDRIGRGRIELRAQQRLERFYQELGFETASQPYDDFGLPHVDMVRSERPTTGDRDAESTRRPTGSGHRDGQDR